MPKQKEIKPLHPELAYRDTDQFLDSRGEGDSMYHQPLSIVEALEND